MPARRRVPRLLGLAAGSLTKKLRDVTAAVTAGVASLPLALPLRYRRRSAAVTAVVMLATLPVELDWDAQASRPRAGLLTYHFSTSYQATMAGRAYGGHGKPAVGRSEGAPSADRGLVDCSPPARERG